MDLLREDKISKNYKDQLRNDLIKRYNEFDSIYVGVTPGVIRYRSDNIITKLCKVSSNEDTLMPLVNGEYNQSLTINTIEYNMDVSADIINSIDDHIALSYYMIVVFTLKYFDMYHPRAKINNPSLLTTAYDSTRQLIVLFSHYTKIFVDNPNILNYYDGSKSYKENLQLMGISNKLLYKSHNNPLYKCDLPFKSVVNYLNSTADDPNDYLLPAVSIRGLTLNRLDHLIWLSQYKWINEYTYINYNDATMKIHNHSLYSIIFKSEPPITDVKVLKASPKVRMKELLKDASIKERYDRFLSHTYKNMYDKTPFRYAEAYKPFFNNIKNDAFDIKLLECPYDLSYEGNIMNHCIGGFNYIDAAKSGDHIFLHVTINGDAYESGVTVHIYICDGKYKIYQAFHHSNVEISPTYIIEVGRILEKLNYNYFNTDYGSNLSKYI